MGSYSKVNKTDEEPLHDGKTHWLDSLRRWRETHIKEKTFVVILALVVGAVSGLAAVLLKFLIGFIAGVFGLSGGGYSSCWALCALCH